MLVPIEEPGRSPAPIQSHVWRVGVSTGNRTERRIEMSSTVDREILVRLLRAAMRQWAAYDSTDLTLECPRNRTRRPHRTGGRNQVTLEEIHAGIRRSLE